MEMREPNEDEELRLKRCNGDSSLNTPAKGEWVSEKKFRRSIGSGSEDLADGGWGFIQIK